MSWQDTVNLVAVAVVMAAIFYHFILRRICVDTAPRNLQVYTALRSPTVREARSALDRRIALAEREARQGARACSVCGFANTTRAAVRSCVLCGAALPVSTRWSLDRMLCRTRRPRRSDLEASTESSRQRRVKRRREWVRQPDSQGAVVWRRDEQIPRLSPGSHGFYVLQVRPKERQQSPASSPTETLSVPHSVDEDQGQDVPVIVYSAFSGDSEQSIVSVTQRLDAALRETTLRIVHASDSGAAQLAFSTSRLDAVSVQGAQCDFPAKLVNFMTTVNRLLNEKDNSTTPAVALFFISRSNLWTGSVEAISMLPVTQARNPIRVAFIGEPGIDAGALYREWGGVINKTLVTPEAGIFTCVDPHEQTFYLNPHSHELLGDTHLAHFLVAGRLIGRALLDGNVTGFQLAPPLLKIMLGIPVGFDDLEYFDAEAFKNLQWLINNSGADMLGLDFTVVEKLPDGTTKVVELVPGGSEIDVTDANKHEYIDRKLKYLLFESVESQLFAFLTGLYEVVPAELLIAFDAEELGLLLGGSNEIDVDDWEANTIAYLDEGREESQTHLSGLPCYDNFWQVVRELSNDERSRLLHFATGSTRPPPGGFSSLTSYDGHLALFTLRGVREQATHGYLQSHACFNRVDLPTFWTLRKMRAAVHAAIAIHEDGFTIA